MTMETNQKFVPVFSADGKLSEHFIGVANIESKDPQEIRKGYERVIRPRFADAKFFFDEDRKQPLAAYQDALKNVTYQQSLGSVWDKCMRVAELSRVIANRVGVDAGLATRAAALSKCDLMTRMVGEFPELQGVMGRYYATASGENAEIAAALDEFYMPRFAGDAIANGGVGRVLAVAERFDTLAGIFAAGLKPSGNKDPFALRRAALGSCAHADRRRHEDRCCRAASRSGRSRRRHGIDRRRRSEIEGQADQDRKSRRARRRDLRVHRRPAARLLRRRRHRHRSVRSGARARAARSDRFRPAPSRRRRVRQASRSAGARGGEQAHRQHPAPGRRARRSARSRPHSSSPAPKRRSPMRSRRRKGTWRRSRSRAITLGS